MAEVVVAKGRRAKKIALHDASIMFNVARMEKNEQLDQLFSRHDEGESAYLNFEQLLSACVAPYIYARLIPPGPMKIGMARSSCASCGLL